MEEALVAYLLDDASLSALVADRITWTIRPQGSTLPAVVLTGVDALPDYTMSGPSGLVSSRLQVDCWAMTYAGGKQIARAVEAALSGIDVVRGGVALRGGFKQGERDSFEKSTGGTELYRVSEDYIIWHGQG
jgi:hypothetical protein